MSTCLSRSLSSCTRSLRQTGSLSAFTDPVKNRCIREFRTKVPLTARRLSGSPRTSLFLFRLRPCIVSVGYRLGFYSVCCAPKRNFSSVATQILSKMPEATKPFQRLPQSVKPQHYGLNLVPDFKTLTFKGDVSVKIEVGPHRSICHAGLACPECNRHSCGLIYYLFTSIFYFIPIYVDLYYYKTNSL